jgi:hypothetical protein
MDLLKRFSVYAKNHETIGLGSILFLVCAFSMDLHVPAVTQHIYGTTDTTLIQFTTGAKSSR